jgi:threonine dehydrogenase-like Zn-dependent dehydrogenase
MKAAVFYAPGDVRVEDVARPQAGKKGVVLRVGACGICNIIDVPHYKMSFPLVDAPPHYYDSKSPVKTGGIILGHEFSGEVVEVGSDVTAVKPGDRVYSVIWHPCGKCDSCRSGDPENCTASDAGGRAINGAMAEYVLLPNLTYPSVIEDKLFKMSDDITFEDGALLEVLRLGIGLANKAKAGDTVVVLGQDIVGLGAVAHLKSIGASKVIACDNSQVRLKASKEVGADIVIDTLNENAFLTVMDATSQKGADIVLETSCRPESLQLAVSMVRPFGDVWLGTFYTSGPFFDPSWQNPGMISMNITQKPGISLHCAWGTLGPWMPVLKIAENIIRSGKITAKKYVTQELPLSQAKAAFEVASNSLQSIKVMLKP